MISWVEDFLCHRTQRVKINGSVSESRPVLSGIPQGSVLGPVLFVIFINDLPDTCGRLCESYLFTDDAKLYKSIVQDGDNALLLKSCRNVIDWCNTWCMNLNIAKCKVFNYNPE